MASPTNGNNQIDPSTRAQEAEAVIRQVAAGKHPSQVAPASAAEDVYDLAERVHDTAKAMRDLANYSNNMASDLERIIAAYIGNMNRLLGKVGK